MLPGTLQELVLLFLCSNGSGSGGFASLAHCLMVLFGFSTLLCLTPCRACGPEISEVLGSICSSHLLQCAMFRLKHARPFVLSRGDGAQKNFRLSLCSFTFTRHRAPTG